mgnify:CR=1 FL=1
MFFSKTLKCCFGEKGFEQLERTYDYVTNQRNPIMQILYTILINAAFGGWMMTGMKKLPTYLVQEHQAYISIVFVLFAQFTYFLACTIGPGTITKENVKCFAHQPFDGLMYLPGSECSSCQIPKVFRLYGYYDKQFYTIIHILFCEWRMHIHLTQPARSKHCTYCHMCVPIFDHHCIWWDIFLMF